MIGQEGCKGGRRGTRRIWKVGEMGEGGGGAAYDRWKGRAKWRGWSVRG